MWCPDTASCLLVGGFVCAFVSVYLFTAIHPCHHHFLYALTHMCTGVRECEDLWANFFHKVYNERRTRQMRTHHRACAHSAGRTLAEHIVVIGAEHCGGFAVFGWGWQRCTRAVCMCYSHMYIACTRQRVWCTCAAGMMWPKRCAKADSVPTPMHRVMHSHH